MITIAELRREFRARAEALRLDPRDVDQLLSDCIGRPQSWLLAHGEESVDHSLAHGFTEQVERRFAGEPLQYIRSRAEFYGREFVVDSRVLIPRPETELLVESVLLRARRGASILDIGTGSGCIAITLQLERPDLRVIGSDISINALAVAQRNAETLGAGVAFTCADLLEAFRGPLDAVVSNPPYIPAGDLPSLQTEVRDHEPRLALTSGTDGLDAIRRLLGSANRLLTRGGLLALEIGFAQSAEVVALTKSSGWPEADVLEDLAGIDRVVILGAPDSINRRLS